MGEQLQDLLTTATRYKSAGLDVIPVDSKQKYPPYEAWESREFTIEFIEQEIKKGRGISLRNTECLDFENKNGANANDSMNKWYSYIKEIAPDILSKVVIEGTMSGGYHVGWRSLVVEERIADLARREPVGDEKKPVLLVEKLGKNNQFLIAPTPGYHLIQGDWAKVPYLDESERAIIIMAAGFINEIEEVPIAAVQEQKEQMVAVQPQVMAQKKTVSQGTRGNFSESFERPQEDWRPGDYYNNLPEFANKTLELLLRHGWQIHHQKAHVVHLTRPGKDIREGSSASLNWMAPNVFHVFSSDAAPFDIDNKKGYSPFDVYTTLEYGGDYSGAAQSILPTLKEMGHWQEPIVVSAEVVEEIKERTKKKELKELETTTQTDTTNAEEIADMFGDEIRYDHKRGRWLLWNGNYWEPDMVEKINLFAVRAAREKQARAIKEVEDPDKRRKVINQAITRESKHKISSALSLLRSLEPVSDRGDGWDMKPWLLGCSNGVLNLRAGRMNVGKREDNITMNTGVRYEPNAKCERWEQFIDEIMMGDEEMKHYLHKVLGYSITGDMSEQLVFFGLGNGANGKSVMFSTLMKVLGDYSYMAPQALLRNDPRRNSSNDLAVLDRKRLVVSSEVLANEMIDESRLKSISGGDRINARRLYQEFETFTPQCKLLVFVNHKPKVNDDSFAFWRRVRVIPFERKFEASEQDPFLQEKLTKEVPGILRWLVEGCILWQREGLQETPGKVLSAVEEYQRENDPLLEFSVEGLRGYQGVEISATEFYGKYIEWADKQRLTKKEILTRTAFGTLMNEKFNKERKRDGVYYRVG